VKPETRGASSNNDQEFKKRDERERRDATATLEAFWEKGIGEA